MSCNQKTETNEKNIPTLLSCMTTPVQAETLTANSQKKSEQTLALEKIDQQVVNCQLCAGLVEKFPTAETVFRGKQNDLVMLGEAPANNGWRKSHKPWRDLNGKTIPSGTILQKLFTILDRDALDTTFFEAVKCYPTERKNLKTCSANCRTIMQEQLKILKPKVILTMGEFATRNLLDFKFERFSDVAGNLYEVDGYKILPIFHPSPASPKCYKDNIPIFEKLKTLLEEK